MKQDDKTKSRIYAMKVSGVYPFYIQKAEKKGRTKDEVDEVIRWLTGYTQKQLETQLENQLNFEEFYKDSPELNPSRTLITGAICGIRVEEIEDPVVKFARQMDKLVDELAKGRSMEKILRK